MKIFGRKLSLRARLLGASGLQLLVLAALGGFALDQMAVMNREAARVESETIPLFRRVADLRDMTTSYRGLQLEYLVLTNRSDRARIRVEMRVIERRAENALRALVEDSAGTEERAAAERVSKLWRRWVDATQSRFLPSASVSDLGTVHPAFTRLNPIYQDLVDASEQLAEESAERTAQGLAGSHASYEKARNLFWIGMIGAFLLAALIGLPLAASLSARLRRLTSATIAVARGDLEGPAADAVGSSRDDELGVLAENFRQMIDALRRKRRMLEERNDELEASLAQQQTLTEELVDREHAEAEARRAKEVAEAADRAKSRFLATMSHELRTPLNSIAGFTQIMELEARMRGEEDLLPDLRRIRVAGNHLLALIDNLLDFSKIEQGKIKAASERIYLHEILQDAIELLAPQAREKRILLESAIDPLLDAPMLGDGVKIRQILFNLLSNAVKYTEQGEIRLTARLEHTDQKEIRRLVVVVRDTGLGMDEQDLERMFIPFERLSSAAISGADGTGLGLAVTRRLCRLMNGEIEVESTPREGSEFTVVLPITQAIRSSDSELLIERGAENAA